MQDRIFHYPVIKISPREVTLPIEPVTSIIFSSRTVVQYLNYPLEDKKLFAIGRATAELLPSRNTFIAKQETAEGIIELLKEHLNPQDRVLYPHSSQSRDLIRCYLEELLIPFHEVILYDTLSQKLIPTPNLSDFEEVIFTSPSTISAFFEIYPTIPSHLRLTPIGPVTKQALQKTVVSFL